MANSYPTSPRADFLLWCQAHTGIFTSNALSIGLTAEQATAFATATANAASFQLLQEEAKQAQKNATMQAVDAFEGLRESAGDTVRLIRTFADLQEDPEAVYALAQVPPPQPKSPQAPPAKPIGLVGILDTSTGALRITWKASNPDGSSGTSYIIKRKLPGETGFTYIATAGQKSYSDGTIPAGVENVQYTIQGQRADSTGPVSEVFTVSFGRPMSGEVTVTTSSAAPKLAA